MSDHQENEGREDAASENLGTTVKSAVETSTTPEATPENGIASKTESRAGQAQEHQGGKPQDKAERLPTTVRRKANGKKAPGKGAEAEGSNPAAPAQDEPANPKIDIEDAIEELKQILKMDLDNGIRAGRICQRLLDDWDYGHYEVRLEKETEINRRTALNYRKLFKWRKRLRSENVSGLTAAYIKIRQYEAEEREGKLPSVGEVSESHEPKTQSLKARIKTLRRRQKELDKMVKDLEEVAPDAAAHLTEVLRHLEQAIDCMEKPADTAATPVKRVA